ncbi:hypothetical protein GA0115260_120793 [Streptomyces sp. MnatMP-M27]|nr:hypothetical protein GA0115260_120793 [Streptomyces sp. MnatMP-M27]
MKSPVALTLLPEHRRGHGAMYGGLTHGRINADRLRTALARGVLLGGLSVQAVAGAASAAAAPGGGQE